MNLTQLIIYHPGLGERRGILISRLWYKCPHTQVYYLSSEVWMIEIVRNTVLCSACMLRFKPFGGSAQTHMNTFFILCHGHMTQIQRLYLKFTEVWLQLSKDEGQRKRSHQGTR